MTGALGAHEPPLFGGATSQLGHGQHPPIIAHAPRPLAPRPITPATCRMLTSGCCWTWCRCAPRRAAHGQPAAAPAHKRERRQLPVLCGCVVACPALCRHLLWHCTDTSGLRLSPCVQSQGDKRLFIRSDELEAAWDLYTPLLHGLEKNKVRLWAALSEALALLRRRPLLPVHRPRLAALAGGVAPALKTHPCARATPPQVAPELYPYGSRGPVGAHYLAAKYGVRWGDLNEDEDD